ncbi:TetR family transcriptional regulator [Clostridium aciditolerans]|uniref:TetR/AcrR family transcriptional regulator n=1 Tax=Clostridium aciditolerans TaxID=339861 RepID=A0A934M3Q4_9CLOT|nr:TetR/AcrR family transcriptional regulator [Clostridium aciditolerans]
MKNTRKHILDVTFKLFLQKSFKEVTLKEIVEKTGLSKGAFYHYFTSKEQLFLELVNDVFSSVLDVPYDQFSKDSLYHFYIDYINYYAENLKQQNEEGSVPSFNYISLIFDAIKLFPDFQERLQKSKDVQLSSWKNIIHTAREKGEISSPMSDEQIANMFISSSSGVEMQSIFSGNSEDIGKTLISLWDSFYDELKA